MQNIEDLKALIALLAPEPRLEIIEAVCRSPGCTAAEVAQALSVPEREAEQHLTALREGGVLAVDADGWRLSQCVRGRIDGAFMHFAADTQNGCGLRLHVPLHVGRTRT